METSKRYVVPAGKRRTVGDMLDRASIDVHAISEGRVFVGRRRVLRADQAVVEGDVIEIAASLPAGPPPLVTVLAQTADLVAVDKPAGLATIPDHSGAARALTTLAASVLGIDPSRLHPTSRLDRDVSGVVIFALTPQAASRLMEARAKGAYERSYVAIATRAPDPESGTWSEPIGRASDPRLRKIHGRNAAAATTRYSSCGQAPRGQTQLAVAPLTGRTHQIRVHSAHAGAPLLGDRAYGGPVRFVLESGQVLELKRIALHARRVVVPVDGTGRTLSAVAAVPQDLRDLWCVLGGDARSWDVLPCK